VTGTCEDCGGDVETQNAAGWYHDRCRACRAAVVAEVTPHVQECTDEDCLVCATHAADDSTVYRRVEVRGP
jgi:hypothetical protein